MRLKEIRRTAATSWCPVAPFSNYMVGGSIAGSLTDFSAQPKLEILDTSYRRRENGGSGKSLVVGSITTSERFTRVSWSDDVGNATSNSSPISTTSSDLSEDVQEIGGLIAGALVDGSIGIWDPRAIIQAGVAPQDEIDMGMIAKLDKHTAAVRGLEFNPRQSNLLASAGDDSQLYIWNLKQPEKPTLRNLTGGSTGVNRNPHHQQIITDLQWNRQFDYILGTTAQNGTCVVWDLKQKKPIVSFSNSQIRKRYSSIAWNPEMFAQLAVASEDDSCPVIEIWDLRKAFAPLMELNGKKSSPSSIPGHSRGILSISWCPDDSQLLLSSGKDNRALIWNPNDGQVLGEIYNGSGQGEQGGEYWMYNVQWSHKPSICSTSSFDGRISIHSLVDSSADEEILDDDDEEEEEEEEEVMGAHELRTSENGANDFMTALGPMSDMSKQRNQLQKNKTSHTMFKTAPKWLKRPAGARFGFGNQLISFNSENRNVTIKQIPSDTPFITRSKLLDKALRREIDYATFCQGRVEGEGSFVWQLMSALFAQDKRSSLLEFLGFEKGKIEEEVQQCLRSDVVTEQVEVGQIDDQLLSKTIMISDFESAVNLCINANRISDALVLASMGGTELWNRTRDIYLEKQQQQQQQRPIMGILHNVLRKDLKSIVEKSDPADWKNTLSMVCTFASKDDDDKEFKDLSRMLADKILTHDDEDKAKEKDEEKGDDNISITSSSSSSSSTSVDLHSLSSEMIEAAVVCLICARDVMRTLSIWSQQESTANGEGNANEDTYEVLDVVERSTVLRELCQAQTESWPQQLIDKIILFADLLAREGLFASSLHFLNGVLPSLKSLPDNVIVLRDRVYYALHKPFGPVPTHPFAVKVVTGRGIVKKAPVSQPQHHQQQRQQQQQQPQQQQQQHAAAANWKPATFNQHSFHQVHPSQPQQQNFPVGMDTRHFQQPQQQQQQQQQQQLAPLGHTPSGFQQPSAPFQPPPQHQPQQHQPQHQPGYQPTPFQPQQQSAFQPQPLQPGFQPVSQLAQPPVPLQPGTQLASMPQQMTPFNPQQANVMQKSPPPAMGSSSLSTPLSPPPTTATTTTTTTTTPTASTSTSSNGSDQQQDGKYVRPQPPYGFGPNRTTSPEVARSSSSTPPTSEDPEEYAQYCLDSLPHDSDKLRKIVQAVSDSFKTVYDGDRVSPSNMAKKRMISNGLRALFQQIASHGLSEGLVSLLQLLLESLEHSDFPTAEDCVRKLSSEHREESKNFVKGLKFLVSVLK